MTEAEAKEEIIFPDEEKFTRGVVASVTTPENIRKIMDKCVPFLVEFHETLLSRWNSETRRMIWRMVHELPYWQYAMNDVTQTPPMRTHAQSLVSAYGPVVLGIRHSCQHFLLSFVTHEIKEQAVAMGARSSSVESLLFASS